MGGLFSSPKPPSQTTQTVVNTPPAYMQPYLQGLADKSQAAYDEFKAKGFDKPYAGDRTVGATQYDPLVTQNVLNAINQTQGKSSDIFDIGGMISSKVKSGGYSAPVEKFNLAPTDTLQAAIAAQTAPIYKKFSEELVPQLKSSAIQAGAYGGSKANELYARVASDTQNQASNIAAQAAYKDFFDRATLEQQDLAQRRQLDAQGKQQELAAAGAVPSLYSAGTSAANIPATLYSGLSDREAGLKAEDIAAQQQYYNELVGSPFAGLGTLSGLLSGANVGGSQATTGAAGNYRQQTQLSPWASLGMAGLSALGSALPSLPTIGMGLGLGGSTIGTLASIGSLFSDIRLKTNIKFAGIKHGFNLYTWSYIWDTSKKYLGVLAQEIEKIIPEAVTDILGVKAVDYSKLGFNMKDVTYAY